MTKAEMSIGPIGGRSFQLPIKTKTSRLFAHQQNHLAKATIKTQRGGRGGASRMSYTFGHSKTYGPVLVARTQKGISALLLGCESMGQTELVNDLQRRFPLASLSPAGTDDAEAKSICDQLDDLTSLPSVSRSLDLHGSAFQRSVWNALLEIPAGRTETYTQLAKRAKLPPTSVRAVANACGQNHIAYLVPCHRIVRSDGDMGGYHWGVHVKKRMLQREKMKN